jgi:NTP pyrophosphatase (non-canonical NTP hydrolase)
MNFNDYQTAAMGFRLRTADAEYARMNLAGEVGELLSVFAKAKRDGVKDPDAFLDQIEKEAGDILWCLAAVLYDCQITLGEAAATNIEKLTLRKAAGTIKGSGNDR